MTDDAEALRLLQAAGGGGAKFVRPADQEVTCSRVAAALSADIRELWQQGPDRTPQDCWEERMTPHVVLLVKKNSSVAAAQSE